MVNLGVIGCGDVAFASYLPGLGGMLDRLNVAACFDIRAERAERAAALYPNAQAYTDYAAFLAHPGMEAVLNLTPAPLHYEITTAALRAGKHVYSEKPLASRLEDARALIEQARASGLLFLCAPGTVVTPRMRWLKGLLDERRLGRPTLATAQIAAMGPAAWRQYTGDPAVFYSPSVGPLIDNGVYLLHAITGLFGPARRVQALGAIAIPQRKVLIPERYGETVEVSANDHMLLHLDFGDATFAQVLSSFAVARSKAPALEVHCTQGSVSISLESWYMPDGPIDIYRSDDSIHGIEGWVQQARLPGRAQSRGTLVDGLSHFVGCLEGRETPALTPEHALHVLEIMLAAERSAREGRALELETNF
ncbi:MAG TPA: Gfo/Idh/MocA family oxidoreductase [Roseiflexaceae bacterium]|nr:Gfo/Idh/MocA family oxidoreductase [Roseiflexaceae bacterium]